MGIGADWEKAKLYIEKRGMKHKEGIRESSGRKMFSEEEAFSRVSVLGRSTSISNSMVS